MWEKNVHSLLARHQPSWREQAMAIHNLGCPKVYMLLRANSVKFQGSQQVKATLLCYQGHCFFTSGSRNTLGFMINGNLYSLKGQQTSWWDQVLIVFGVKSIILSLLHCHIFQAKTWDCRLRQPDREITRQNHLELRSESRVKSQKIS